MYLCRKATLIFSWKWSLVEQTVSGAPRESETSCFENESNYVNELFNHDDFNTEKVCNSANPTQVGFVHMYEHCYLITCDAFYVTFHWEF